MKYLLPILVLLASNCFGQTLDKTKWFAMNEFGRGSNGEVECYLPSQDAVTGSLLVLTAVKQPSTCTNSYVGNGTGTTTASYASGEIESVFSFTYGTIKYTAKFAGGAGTWPAIWLLGSNCQPTTANGNYKNACNWPAAGSNEIDITEIKNGALTSPYQNVVDASGTWYSCRPTVTDVSLNYHNYTFIWTATSLIWQIDGITTCTQTSANYIPTKPMFLIINTALGGNGGGSINDSTLSKTNTTVQSIQVLQNNVVVFDGGFSTTQPAPPTDLTITEE